MREIVFRGSRGGSLAPLADQLNHDLTHLQAERVESKLEWLLVVVQDALARAGGGPEAPRKPIRLPPRLASLAGRDELLAELDTRLTGGGDPGPRTVVLCGLGGTGKTTVAVEYAHRHLTEVGVAWQLAAEDPTVLTAGFGELAAQLGAQDDVRGPVAWVHGVLAAFPAAWLLVFDNAADRASVAAFLPPAGPGRVLITSQNPNWPGQGLDVPVLAPKVAAEFLADRTGDPDRPAAVELAGELGGLPLALEQAAAYIQATGMTLAGYLSVFRGREADLLGRGEPTGHIKTVATTWELAFAKLEESAPAAAALLRLLAFCAPEAIPLRLLVPRPELTAQLRSQVPEVLVPPLDDQLAAEDAIAALRRHSLISPAAEGSVLVHRLVQAVTRDQMPSELRKVWQRAAAAVIEAALPADPDLPQNRAVLRSLLPHAQAALTDSSSGMRKIATFLGTSGNYAAARDLFQRVLKALERVLGPEHRDTLTVRASLAHYTGRAGDEAGARDQYAALLPMRERILRREQRDTLTTRDWLAYWAGRAGDAAGARDQFAELTPVVERILGPEDPETLTARAGLARFTGEAGDAAGARDEYAALLPVRERVLGGEDSDTLTTRDNLVRWTGEAGDAARARDQFAELLPVRERVSGPEHPHTLTARAYLARFTGEAGDAAGARDQFAELLPVRERVSGPEHPHTLETRQELAYWGG